MFQRYVRKLMRPVTILLLTSCLCQQSFKVKCTEYSDSLKEIRETAPETFSYSQPEVKDVYGSLLDELNGKYERLLSLFQKLLDDAKDIDREVSHSEYLLLHLREYNNPHGHGREKEKLSNLEFKCA